MPTYRFQIPATICFDVQAESPEAAVDVAERVRSDNNTDGWDLGLSLDGKPLENAWARTYVDDDAIRTTPLTTGDIVDEEADDPPTS
jgi:hypothetical protein